MQNARSTVCPTAMVGRALRGALPRSGPGAGSVRLAGGVRLAPVDEVLLAPQRGASDVGRLREAVQPFGVVVDRPSGDPEKVGCSLRVDPAAHVHTEYGKTYALSAYSAGCRSAPHS